MNELYHHGIMGQKWGVRRYQNSDGTLTPAGKKRYAIGEERLINRRKKYASNIDKAQYSLFERKRDSTLNTNLKDEQTVKMLNDESRVLNVANKTVTQRRVTALSAGLISTGAAFVGAAAGTVAIPAIAIPATMITAGMVYSKTKS